MRIPIKRRQRYSLTYCIDSNESLLSDEDRQFHIDRRLGTCMEGGEAC